MTPRFLRIAGAVLLALGLAGCAMDQYNDADMCTGVAPGWARVAEIRTDKWPWNRQHTLIAKRDEKGTCSIELEQPSSADLMSELSSPISTAASHVVLPVIP